MKLAFGPLEVCSAPVITGEDLGRKTVMESTTSQVSVTGALMDQVRFLRWLSDYRRGVGHNVVGQELSECQAEPDGGNRRSDF